MVDEKVRTMTQPPKLTDLIAQRAAPGEADNVGHERHQLYRELAQSAQEVRLLDQVLAAVTSSSDQDALIRTMGFGIKDLLPYERWSQVRLALLNDDQQHIEVYQLIGERNNPFWDNVGKGIQAVAHELGVEARFAMGTMHSEVSQEMLIDQAIRDGISGMAIAPADAEAIEPAIRRAREAGIPLISFATPAIAQSAALLDIVGHKYDRLVELTLDISQLPLQARAGDRIDRAERFVHQHDRRVGRQGARQAHALLLAAGELAWVARAVGARQAHQLEQRVDPRVDARLRPAEQTRHHRDVLLDPHMREQPGLLDRIPDPAAQLGGLQPTRVHTVDQDAPAGRLVEAVDHFEQRGFAAAGWPKQHHKRAILDLEADMIDGRARLAWELLGKLLDDDGTHNGLLVTSSRGR
jgi:hypothetical protein